MNLDRYQCNLVLDGFGFEGQKRLKDASALIIGLGGIGSVVSTYLVANGIGRIGICDFDFVSDNNLTRQILYNTTDIGKKKAEVSYRKLSLLNPEVKITSLSEAINERNADNVLSKYDFIMECSDSLETKRLINKVCMNLNKKFVVSSAIGYKGNVMTVFNADDACWECIFEVEGSTPPMMLPTCADNGVFPTVPGLVGLLSVTKVMEEIIHPDECNLNFITVDIKSSSIRYLKINKNSFCSLHNSQDSIRCGNKKDSKIKDER